MKYTNYEQLLGEVGGDPRTLAAAAENPEVAAMLGLNFQSPTGGGNKDSEYEQRLELVGGDPRTLAAAAENPEVAAILGLSL